MFQPLKQAGREFMSRKTGIGAKIQHLGGEDADNTLSNYAGSKTHAALDWAHAGHKAVGGDRSKLYGKVYDAGRSWVAKKAKQEFGGVAKSASRYMESNIFGGNSMLRFVNLREAEEEKKSRIQALKDKVSKGVEHTKGYVKDVTSKDSISSPVAAQRQKNRKATVKNVGKAAAGGAVAAAAGYASKKLYDRYKKRKEEEKKTKESSHSIIQRACLREADEMDDPNWFTKAKNKTGEAASSVGNKVGEWYGAAKDKAAAGVKYARGYVKDVASKDYVSSPMARERQAGRKAGLKTAGKYAGGAALGLGAAYGAKKLYDRYKSKKQEQQMNMRQSLSITKRACLLEAFC